LRVRHWRMEVNGSEGQGRCVSNGHCAKPLKSFFATRKKRLDTGRKSRRGFTEVDDLVAKNLADADRAVIHGKSCDWHGFSLSTASIRAGFRSPPGRARCDESPETACASRLSA